MDCANDFFIPGKRITYNPFLKGPCKIRYFLMLNKGDISDFREQISAQFGLRTKVKRFAKWLYKLQVKYWINGETLCVSTIGFKKNESNAG